MKVGVFGLWHLGCVTAACLADIGFEVLGIDTDVATINKLAVGELPVYEPGLQELTKKGISSGKLSFTPELNSSLEKLDLLWVTIDTPVDDKDMADVEYVKKQVKRILPFLKTGCLVIVSSQVPVGFTSEMESYALSTLKGSQLTFSYSPENLRLGNAINIFQHPDRIIVGVRNESDKDRFNSVFSKISESIIWMKTESAEMTKHAINVFLALSVTFANEIAGICEKVGADSSEVEKGLKSEQRIGPKAYLRAGNSFSGGTLARDTVFLKDLSCRHSTSGLLFEAILNSNENHKNWIKSVCQKTMTELKNRRILFLGLSYKTGTDTLRRSLPVETAIWLKSQGASVIAYDPLIYELPKDLSSSIQMGQEASECIQNAECIIIGNNNPAFKQLAQQNKATFNGKIIIDPECFIKEQVVGCSDVKYYYVGGFLN